MADPVLPKEGLTTQQARDIWGVFDQFLHNGNPIPVDWLADSLAAGEPLPLEDYPSE